MLVYSDQINLYEVLITVHSIILSIYDRWWICIGNTDTPQR